jgi:hypothetical protein
MVDEKEFKDFIKQLGFPIRLYKLIDDFWELVFKEKIFENYQIQYSEARPSGLSTRKTSKIISMKAFFYNYRKFYTDRVKYVFVFSPNMLKQRNIDLRYELYPWKTRFRYLDHRLKDLRSIEFAICEKVGLSNKQLADDLLQTIE